MADVKRVEYLFLGGGKGGKSLAMEMARQGKRVAVIERGMIGGSCINVACIPSKALIHRARRMHAWRDASQREDVAADMAGVSAYVASVVNGWSTSIAAHSSNRVLNSRSGRAVRRAANHRGARRRRDRNDLRGRERLYQHGYGRVVPGRAGAARRAAAHARGGVATDDASRASGRHRRRLYRAGDGSSLSAARQRGHARQRYAARCDARRRGCQYGHSAGPDRRRYSARTRRAARRRTGKAASASRCGWPTAVPSKARTCSWRPGARRRRPASAGAAGVETNERGFIKVDHRLATTAERTWAIGEVAGTPMFTHASFDDYRVLKAGIEGRPASTAERLIPYALFIDPVSAESV